jgi:hypothetical protein
MVRQTKGKERRAQQSVATVATGEFVTIPVKGDTKGRTKIVQGISEAVSSFPESKKVPSEKKDFFAMSSEERTSMYAEATRAEVALHHAAGRYTTHGDEKGVYRLYPDGRKVYIDRIDRDKKRG